MSSTKLASQETTKRFAGCVCRQLLPRPKRQLSRFLFVQLARIGHGNMIRASVSLVYLTNLTMLISGFLAGLTPLHAAIANRHWDTAQLVLAIAKAQYVEEEVKEEKFRIKDIALGT
jgi:hypothetical protein